MEDLLLRALYAMRVAEFTTSDVARSAGSDSVEAAFKSRTHQGFTVHSQAGNRANDAIGVVNKDRRGKNAAGHSCHGRRLTDLPYSDNVEYAVDQLAKHL